VEKKAFYIADLLIFLFFIALILITSISFLSTSDSIIVKAGDKEYRFSAKDNGIYSVEGVLGETVIEIKDGKIRFLSSPCPSKSCISNGFSSTVICLPNMVIATSVEKEGDVDEVAR